MYSTEVHIYCHSRSPSSRIREKCEAELREVERSERNTLQKFNTMKVSISTPYQRGAATLMLLLSSSVS